MLVRWFDDVIAFTPRRMCWLSGSMRFTSEKDVLVKWFGDVI